MYLQLLAVWGDPHVITFDGLTYDCNAAGLFTIMKNFLYNIQGLFVNVNTSDMDALHGMDAAKHPRATYATDIVIDNVENPDIPVLQFSFPEHIADELVAEEGCYAYYTLDRYLQGYPAKTVSTISECRQYCLDTEGCYNFQFTYGSGHCRVAPHEALIQQMSGGDFQARTIAGPVDKCGKDYTERGGDVHEFANWYGNDIKYGDTGVCPLLFYVDGELVDISTLSTSDNGVGDYLYGDSNSDVWVQLYLRNKIRIVTKTLEGNLSEITLEVGGQGPGGLFGCHFNIFVCLPSLEQGDFTSSTVGLLGSPDLDPENDWMAKDGTLIPVPTGGTTLIREIDALRGEEAFNYCIEK